MSYGTSGVGGTPHIAGELLAQQTGAKLVHVPYKGGGQAMADALGGQIPLVFTAVAGAQQHVKSGKLAAIAVSSAKRTSALPDVPTFIESGVPDFVVSSWVGILAPAKTPQPIVERLNRELNAVLATPEMIEQLGKLGIAATPGTPDAFGAQIRADLDEVRKGREGRGHQGRVSAASRRHVPPYTRRLRRAEYPHACRGDLPEDER